MLRPPLLASNTVDTSDDTIGRSLSSSDFVLDSSDDSNVAEESDEGGAMEDLEIDVAQQGGTEDEEDEETEVILSDSYDDDLDPNSDEQQNTSSNEISTALIRAISFFLLFFQLKFRVPDRAINFLLSFLKGFLSALIVLIPSCQVISTIHRNIPKCLQSLRQRFSSCRNKTTMFVVCPKCCSLYKLDDCIIVSRGVPSSKTCSFVQFPNHPQKRRRAPCGTALMKKTKFGSNYKLVPKKTFTYNQGFIQRGGCPGISPPKVQFPPPQEFHITMS